MKVIYIAGPYSAESPYYVEQNIRCAEEVALEVWQMGAAALCPHTMTRHYGGVEDVTDAQWLGGTLEMMRRCDAVLVVDRNGRQAKGSRGTTAELREALRLGIPVFFDLRDLRNWLATTTDEVQA